VIIPQLQKQGAKITAFDPQAMETAKAAMPDLHTAASIGEAVEGADAVLILTEWSEFSSIDWKSLLPDMRSPVVIDFRNLYDPDQMADMGAAYYSLGRPAGIAKGTLA
jgi:UDPglucose 6-dehydrogenase